MLFSVISQACLLVVFPCIHWHLGEFPSSAFFYYLYSNSGLSYFKKNYYCCTNAFIDLNELAYNNIYTFLNNSYLSFETLCLCEKIFNFLIWLYLLHTLLCALRTILFLTVNCPGLLTELKLCWLYPLQRLKPLLGHKCGVLDITLYCIWW